MNYLNVISRHVKALNVRERVLLGAAILGVVYFVLDLALLRPYEQQGKVLRDKLQQQALEVSSLQSALLAIAPAGAADPLARQRAERDQLRNTVAQAESVIGRATADLKLGDVIRTIVAAKPGLTLVTLKTLPVETIFTASAPIPTAPAAPGAAPLPPLPSLPTLYKHGIDVTVRGSYAALLPYLQELEGNGNLFWGNVRLDVVDYPEATLKLTIYTLSARPESPLV